jgi:hypothetical protein
MQLQSVDSAKVKWARFLSLVLMTSAVVIMRGGCRKYMRFRSCEIVKHYKTSFKELKRTRCETHIHLVQK